MRSALLASRAAVSAAPRTTPLAARIVVSSNAVKVAPAQAAVRFFSQTLRQSSEFESQNKEEAEELMAQTNVDIQESFQEAAPESLVQEQRPERKARVEPQPNSAFVRNLVFELTEEHLTKAFAKYGDVKSAFVARDPRGMSKGYGFVSFGTPEELEAACVGVNGSFWHGRRITCIPRSAEETRGDRRRSTPNEPTNQLFLGNLPYETTDTELNRLFEGIDNLKDVRVAVDRTTGWPRGFAHAEFTTVEAASEALRRLTGAKLGDREVRVDFASGYSKRGRKGGEGELL
ncbi:hypothetical protein C8A05DRAFT_33555 [Staphylotrichum tortipilum]|uniref:RRM domain-containing protein n=1 Tax=Staphylotrichum tortipilum TaxID=2831512 RepID=A0AAN6RTD4_9PEZI|nr:hypothetical protein C8A05DRAFT_33555 [Staphylotrichum longicolle]